MSVQNSTRAARGATPATVLHFPLAPATIDEAALRAQIRSEVLAGIERDVAGALTELERAARECARITVCREYAAPSYIQSRLHVARQSLLNVISDTDSPDDNSFGESEADEEYEPDTIASFFC